MKFLEWMNKQSKLIKILFALPFVDIVWGIYRVMDGFYQEEKDKKVDRIFLGIVSIFLAFFWGIFDIIMIAIKGHIWWEI